MNWGYKILITFIVFVTVMLGMVYVASKQTNEMQETNYYEKELVYQEVINGKNNLQAAGGLALQNNGDTIAFKAPVSVLNNIKNGTVYFLCPSDEKADLHLPFVPNADGLQYVPKSKLKKVLYTVRISWKNNDKPFYFEQQYSVN
mgnify:CR=1 FL=1